MSISPFGSNIVPEEYLDDVYTVMTDIITKQIMAVPDADNSNAPVNLYLSASSSLVLQSKNDLKVDLAPTSAFNIYEASGAYNDTISETQIFSLSANSNVTSLSFGSNSLALIPGDTNKTTNVGSLIVNESLSSQLVDTSKYDIKLMKDLTVLGNLNTTGTFYSSYLNSVNLVVENNINTTNQVSRGSSFGNNMNIWINKGTASDQETNRIGYGFHINSNTEQLELFKYKRYSFVDSNGEIQNQGKTQYRKVAQFGFGVTTYDKDTDLFDTNVFDTLDAIASSSNLSVDNSGSAGTAGSTYWVLNSNANIYYYGNIGINQQQPQYALDINGSINASDTIISNNYATASDIRIKTDITHLNNAVCLDTIKKLNPCSYNHEILKARKTGFIAQELKEIIPESVEVKLNTSLDMDDFHYVDYNSLISYLVGAVKELDRKVAQLESASVSNVSLEAPVSNNDPIPEPPAHHHHHHHHRYTRV